MWSVNICVKRRLTSGYPSHSCPTVTRSKLIESESWSLHRYRAKHLTVLAERVCVWSWPPYPFQELISGGCMERDNNNNLRLICFASSFLSPSLSLTHHISSLHAREEKRKSPNWISERLRKWFFLPPPFYIAFCLLILLLSDSKPSSEKVFRLLLCVEIYS